MTESGRPAAPASNADRAAREPRQQRPTRMDALATLPVFLKLNGKRAVLSGGNDPALWKAELLAAAGADVHVFASHFEDGFADLATDPPAGAITLHARVWQPTDLTDAAIAIGAITDDAEAARFVAAAKAAGAAVNVIDRPEFCAFQFGAIVNRSPLVVAISTDGGAPVFGQAIRSRLEALLPRGFKAWANAAKDWRRAGDRLGPDIKARRRFWERFTDLAMRDAERAPSDADLENLIAEVAQTRASSSGNGFVTLVGAGPGDPELLTLKAVRALRAADVVLYDDLVTAPVLEFARREARRILVGKTGYGPACKQTDINRMMVELARDGNRVVRLKSGDPLIFGRGGEEIDDLKAAGIGYDVVPGISAAQGAASSMKISLTHRDSARRVQFITGHSRDGRLPQTLDWQALADPGATTVVYMANRTLPELSARMIGAGLPPDTPACAVFDATRPTERMIAETVAGLPAALEAAKHKGPCLVMVGVVLAPLLEGHNTEVSTVVPDLVSAD